MICYRHTVLFRKVKSIILGEGYTNKNYFPYIVNSKDISILGYFRLFLNRNFKFICRFFQIWK